MLIELCSNNVVLTTSDLSSQPFGKYWLTKLTVLELITELDRHSA